MTTLVPGRALWMAGTASSSVSKPFQVSTRPTIPTSGRSSGRPASAAERPRPAGVEDGGVGLVGDHGDVARVELGGDGIGDGDHPGGPPGQLTLDGQGRGLTG